MFIQIIQGRCSRQEELHTLLERWREERAPQVDGWLGGTYGVTDDGMFLGIVRFEDRDKAMANSDSADQSQWADQFSALFDGPVAYHDCEDVTLFLDGGSDRAGFVQVVQGKVDDPSRLKAMMANTTQLQQMRPEVIGGTLALEPDGTFTETVFFTDEASARKGEQLEPPEEVREELAYAMRDARFYDLHHPWFQSAGSAMTT